jgi:hypothetical protein
MFPHERSLVKRLATQPFALIGVNSDSDREATLQRSADESIVWRSFWNGGSTRGPISTEWNVRAWPTIYILDAAGVIRYKRVGGREEEIDATIDRLLKEIESGAAPASTK